MIENLAQARLRVCSKGIILEFFNYKFLYLLGVFSDERRRERGLFSDEVSEVDLNLFE